MNVQMADVSGLEVTRRVREWERESGGRTPILLLGAWAVGALFIAFTIFMRKDVFG